NHDCVGSDITQALPAWTCQAGHSTRQIKGWQHIYESEQVSKNNLGEPQTQPLGVDYPQAQNTLSDGLATPVPLQQDSIADRNQEIGEDREGCGKIWHDQS